MEQALEALEICRLNGSQYLYGNERDVVFAAISAIRAALAEHAEDDALTAAWMAGAAEERKRRGAAPVAWRYKPMMGSPWSLSDDGYYISCKRDRGYIVEPLYTTPPAPQEPVACHVFNVTVSGRLHEWEPTTFAFALKDGKHALYTASPAPQPVDPWPQIRRDFEQRMRAVGFTPTCLTWLDGGIYASPAVNSEWTREKLKYLTPAPQPQPLADEDLQRMWSNVFNDFSGKSAPHVFARAVEREVLRRMGVRDE